MGPFNLRFDVTDALPSEVTGGKRIDIVAWLFFPSDRAKLGAKPTTMVLLNGGSYDKRYFHVEIPEREGYSAARHLAELGNVVLVPDHLGTGESTRVPVQKKATRHVAALASHAAVESFYERLRGGTLHVALPPIPSFRKIGGGHSMGGMQTIVQQAAHNTHDGIMILGYTAQGVHFTMGGKKLSAAAFLPTGEVPDYTTNDRSRLREGFHWEDVPDDVVAADDALAVETAANLGLDSIRTGIVVDDAAKIRVPVYFCLGERDVSPAPHLEPSFFTNTTDFTLHILPRSAHCQNFAGTRHVMWNRMHDWARGIGGSITAAKPDLRGSQ